jgi:predicted nucleotidyltransferase
MDISAVFYTEVLEVLNSHKVKYILVGGLAVSFHGYPRYTGDMDLWIEPEPDNLENLYTALIRLGYSQDTVQNISKNRDINHPTPIRLKDDHHHLSIDLMTNTFQQEFTWQECYEDADVIETGSLRFPVVNLDRLIIMKEKSQRLDDSLKDLADAQELKKIRHLKGGGNEEKR